jgi:hypothetical protein
VAEWLKAPDSKSKNALFAMFSFGTPPLIRSMFTMVLFISAFAAFGRVWLQKTHIV